MKPATPQERKVLANIPSSKSGQSVAIQELAENLRASDGAVRVVLSHLHRKNLIAVDDVAFNEGCSTCLRTELGDQAIAKKRRSRR